MFASPDGLDGVDAKMFTLVFLVVTLKVATVFRNVPLIFAVIKPLDAKVIPVTPSFVEAGLVRVNVITVSEPVGTLCPPATVSTKVPDD